MSADNSRPAFPATSWNSQGDFLGANTRMTLRDYFAAKAMAALIVAPKADWPDAEETESVSEKAYLLADAMLKERAK